MRGTGFEPEEDVLTRSARCARLPGFKSAPALSLSRYAPSLSARDRIWTGGPLRDSVL